MTKILCIGGPLDGQCDEFHTTGDRFIATEPIAPPVSAANFDAEYDAMATYRHVEYRIGYFSDGDGEESSYAAPQGTSVKDTIERLMKHYKPPTTKRSVEL